LAVPSLPQRVLVTGAGGFLGSALSAALLERGHRVLGVDTSWAHGRLADHAGLDKVVGDVRDAGLMAELASSVDRILHMGAVAGVHDYQTRPFEVLDVNIVGTRNVLLAAKNANKPVVFASSSEAYGKNPLLLREDAATWLGPTTQSRWCYGTSKVAGEHFAWSMIRDGLVAAAVRYFNAYGPRLDAPGQGRVVSQFLGALQEGRPLKLVDGGQAVRCFCYVDDAVEATLSLLFALGVDPDALGRPFNVGNPEPVTMAELANAIVHLTGHEAGTEVVSGPAFFGKGFEEIPHRVPDVSALDALIGFRAQISLEEGLRRTLRHWGLLKEDAGPLPPPFVPNVRPQYAVDESLLNAWLRAAETGRTTNNGEQTLGLERELSAFFGAEGVLAVGSGADALNIALRGVRLLTDRPVAVLPSYTYISTLNAVELAGFEPVLCDIDPGTWTMDPTALRAILEARGDVGVIIPVNVFGVPADLDAICAIAEPYGAQVIYDDAQGVGASIHGRRVHPGVVATTWSFHATKLLPGIEGGALHAAHPLLRERCFRVRTHGLPPDPLGHVTGFNAKIDELSAATIRHGLGRVGPILEARRRNWLMLRAGLAEIEGVELQQVTRGALPNGQNLVVRVPCDVSAAIAAFRDAGLEARRYFEPPVHHLRRFSGQFTLPITQAVWSTSLSLPLHTSMRPQVVERILSTAARVFPR
jgi:nucleoside-diphosphate-sugar epimerase/dTDP-4-amino-4,6-dideoxygalactose transaminase